MERMSRDVLAWIDEARYWHNEMNRCRDALLQIVVRSEELTDEFGEDGTHKGLELIARAAIEGDPRQFTLSGTEDQ